MAINPVTRPPELRFETEKKTSETTLRAMGRITVTSNALLEQALRDLIAEGKQILLDLTEVEYVDSAGLGALVSVYMHARRANCPLKIVNPKQRIRDLFERSRLSSVFEGDSFDVLWNAWSGGSVIK